MVEASMPAGRTKIVIKSEESVFTNHVPLGTSANSGTMEPTSETNATVANRTPDAVYSELIMGNARVSIKVDKQMISVESIGEDIYEYWPGNVMVDGQLEKWEKDGRLLGAVLGAWAAASQKYTRGEGQAFSLFVIVNPDTDFKTQAEFDTWSGGANGCDLIIQLTGVKFASFDMPINAGERQKDTFPLKIEDVGGLWVDPDDVATLAIF